MPSAIINTMKIDGQLLKRLSSLYEEGLSIKAISDKLDMDEQTIVRLLRLLGFNTGVLEETWLVN